METCTRTNRGHQTRKGRMNATMGVGNEGRHPELPGVLGKGFIGETSYRGFYRFWAEMMAANGWDDIRAKNDTWAEEWIGDIVSNFIHKVA